MPYRRRSYRRPMRRRARRPSRRPRPMSSADMAWSLAKRAWTNTKFLKGIINSEKKYIDLSFNNNPDVSSGTVNFLNDIPVGDTAITRDGNSVRMKSLSIKGVIQLNTSATQTYVRMLVVQWYANVLDVTPSFADVLESLSITSHYNKDYVGNFRVLTDRNMIVDTQFPLKTFSFYYPLNAVTRWLTTDTSGDQTSMTKNGLYFMCFSSEATNTPAVNITSRVLFYDN